MDPVDPDSDPEHWIKALWGTNVSPHGVLKTPDPTHLGWVLNQGAIATAYVAVYFEPYLYGDFLFATVLVLFQVIYEQYGIFYKLPK